MKKFFVVVGNPPYQAPSKNNNKGAGNTLWNKFVEKSFDISEENGHVCIVHPSGWRNVGGRFTKCKDLLNSKQIEYLEIHNVDDGIKTFGAGTRYDWYVAKNCNVTKKTIIFGEDKVFYELQINEEKFIPNGMINEVKTLFADDPKNRISFLYNCNYHSVNGPVSKNKDEKFIYPCIQNISSRNNNPTCIYYSDTNEKGHFGIPKVIFGRQVSGVFIDKVGNYGMSDCCAGILDIEENLENIQKAMMSEKFILLMKMCDVGGNRDRFNRKVISLFRKDFWKEFV